MGVPEINERLERFRSDLRSETPERVFADHVVGQPCYALDDSEEAAIARHICARFGVPAKAVVIVGSAKLGFTLVDKPKPGRAMRPRYSSFSDASDVDVAIVSDSLFDKYWKVAYEFYRARVLWDQRERFQDYLLRGWIIPPFLPNSTTDSTAVDWNAFLNSLVRTGECGEYPIKAGIYRDYHFFATYHYDTIAKLKRTEETLL